MNTETIDEEDWEEVEVVSGRLIRVNKADREITVEVEEFDHDTEQMISVQQEYSVSDKFSESDFKDLLEGLDRVIKVKLIDGEVSKAMIS